MATKYNSKIKLSPKLIELCKTPLIDSVNAMLDAGESPNSVCKYINQNNFKISTPLVYEYAKIRKQCIIDNINIEHILGVIRKPVQMEKTSSFNQKKQTLKSEIEALDRVIQLGYTSLERFYGDDTGQVGKPVPIATMMSAIQLKNSLTEGSHGFLTDYGLTQLREIEKQKYEIVIDMIMSYIPEEQQQEVLDKIEETEDEYYAHTEYYEEYLRAKGLSDEDVMKKLQQLEKEQQEMDIDSDDSDEEPPVVIKI